ncbi:MAG: hypothetical protein AB8B82_13610 [Roseovarius sp.]
MTKFMLAYHGGGAPDTPEQGAEEMAKWEAWLNGMGPSCADMGNPVGMSRTVTHAGVENNGGANPLSGYSIVEASDIDAACEMAKGCPILEGGKGTIEVAPIVEM